MDKAAKKDNLSPLKTKERRGKSEADEQQDTKRMKADVAPAKIALHLLDAWQLREVPVDG